MFYLPYIYPQLNQNEPVYGSKLGIVNKLNCVTINFFSICFNDNYCQGTNVLLEIILTSLSGDHERRIVIAVELDSFF